jgi:hypothetical protein
MQINRKMKIKFRKKNKIRKEIQNETTWENQLLFRV